MNEGRAKTVAVAILAAAASAFVTGFGVVADHQLELRELELKHEGRMAKLEAECIVRERPAPPPRGPGLHLELPNMFGGM